MTRTVLSNVRVFDGSRLLEPGTAVIDGTLIGDPAGGPGDPAGGSDFEIDGAGGALLPGLIDAHVHLHGRESLEALLDFGVTTAFDMASPPPSWPSMRGVEGLTDFRSAGIPAIAPDSPHSHIPVMGERGLIRSADEAEAFVAARVAEGSDYLKIIVGNPAPSHDQATLDALVAAAHRHGLRTVAHVAASVSVEMAQRAGVDVLTHVPLDRPAERFTEGIVLIPTLTMMEGVIEQSAPPHARYDAARTSVTNAYRAGVPILAGTDANTARGVPARIKHGESLHRELELLVDAGLTPLDALRAATSVPAEYFGLADRGAVIPGRRADLVLVDGDPTTDIRATRAIRRIWCAGTEHTPR